MTIQEAWKRILEIRGERETKLTIEFWQYGADIGGQKIKLSLWDGNKHYHAESLEDLIQLAVVSVVEKTTKVIEVIGAIDGELPRMGGEDEPAS